jgi:aspartate/methionine/tyrosine aminotransferase
MEATQGIKVTSLCVGEPDFSPPSSVIQSMITFLSTSSTTINQATKYTAVSGLLSLRQAIAKDMQTRKRIVYQPNTDILISNGAKQSVYQAIWAMAGTDDVVLIPSPYWPSYPEEVRLTGAIPIILPTTMDNGYRLTASTLEQALQTYPQTKVLILCNPCNPTGTVYSESELQDLCQVLQHYPNVTVIADEIYERLVYTDGPAHVSIASLPNMYHRTITINGFSKSHAMTGLRIGYSCAPSHITTAMTTLQSQLTSCANAISQYAAIAALEETPDTWMSEVIATMQQKRDYIIERLTSLPFVSISKEYPPTGAFYVLPDVRRYCPILTPESGVSDDDSESTSNVLYDDVSFCLQLLEQEQLAIVPGTSFGLTGTVRLSYATSMEELEVAMKKFEHYLTQLRNERPDDFLQ